MKFNRYHALTLTHKCTKFDDDQTQSRLHIANVRGHADAQTDGRVKPPFNSVTMAHNNSLITFLVRDSVDTQDGACLPFWFFSLADQQSYRPLSIPRAIPVPLGNSVPTTGKQICTVYNLTQVTNIDTPCFSRCHKYHWRYVRRVAIANIPVKFTKIP